MKIFLIGYRCTGKTSIGKILARSKGFDFLDTDLMVEQLKGINISKIVERYGWENFRALEKQMLLTTKNQKNIVIATGGGIISDLENQSFIMKSGFCIWLNADIKTILHRMNTDSKTSSSRPSLTNKDILKETKELLKLRNPLYEKTANIKIDVNYKTPEEIVNIIHRRLS